jgi:hypothetical protein
MCAAKNIRSSLDNGSNGPEALSVQLFNFACEYSMTYALNIVVDEVRKLATSTCCDHRGRVTASIKLRQ